MGRHGGTEARRDGFWGVGVFDGVGIGFGWVVLWVDAKARRRRGVQRE